MNSYGMRARADTEEGDGGGGDMGGEKGGEKGVCEEERARRGEGYGQDKAPEPTLDDIKVSE
mgnify:CR=1 FL=1